MHTTFSWQRVWLWVAGLLTAQVGILFLFGQPLICACGTVRFWQGIGSAFADSQQLADWYTFSHIIHGVLFYLLVWALLPQWPVWKRLVLALGIEVGWEILENTPWVIAHYRAQAIAATYAGDSILNSVSDSLAALVGFLFASRVPLWASVALVVVLEVWVGYTIHDNLTLNILNFIHPLSAVTAWQSAVL